MGAGCGWAVLMGVGVAWEIGKWSGEWGRVANVCGKLDTRKLWEMRNGLETDDGATHWGEGRVWL